MRRLRNLTLRKVGGAFKVAMGEGPGRGPRADRERGVRLDGAGGAERPVDMRRFPRLAAALAH